MLKLHLLLNQLTTEHDFSQTKQISEFREIKTQDFTTNVPFFSFDSFKDFFDIKSFDVCHEKFKYMKWAKRNFWQGDGVDFTLTC